MVSRLHRAPICTSRRVGHRELGQLDGDEEINELVLDALEEPMVRPNY